MTWERETPYQAHHPPAEYTRHSHGLWVVLTFLKLGRHFYQEGWRGPGSQAKFRAPDPQAASYGFGEEICV